MHKYRHWLQAAWMALTNSYATGFVQGKIFRGETKAVCVPGLNCYSCPGARGACPIGSLQAVLDSREFTVSCYVLGFIMLFGVTMGRLVCGFLCPFGFVQDMLYKIPLGKKRKNLPGHRWLKYLKYVVLVVLVLLLPSLPTNLSGGGDPWFCKWVCPSGTLMGGIPLVLTNEGLRGAVGALFTWKMALLLIILALSVLWYRPFCKYLCPLGALYGICNPIALYGFRVDEKKCTRCGQCQTACGMGLAVYKTPNSAECIRCGDCRAVCPTGAISLKSVSRKAARAQKNAACDADPD
ncbi:MAG: 4Fe-4S binding protein [Ruthenibacterium sp.]